MCDAMRRCKQGADAWAPRPFAAPSSAPDPAMSASLAHRERPEKLRERAATPSHTITARAALELLLGELPQKLLRRLLNSSWRFATVLFFHRIPRLDG